jgi:hypothetical protein
MTLPATDACIEVHKSSHLFGKKYSLVASRINKQIECLDIAKDFLPRWVGRLCASMKRSC